MARAARGAASRKKKSNIVTVNFKGVQSRQTLPEDDYLVKLVEVNQTTSGNDNDQLEFIFEVEEGKYEGQKLWFYCVLTDTSLWKLHGLLTAMGEEVPDDEMDIDIEELVENEPRLMAVVQHDTFEGTKRSKMMDFYAVEEKEEPKGKAKAGAKGKAKDEPEEEEMTPAQRRKARREARKAKDEPEEKSTRGSKKKGPPKLSADEVQGMDEDELSDVIDTYKLEVDLDDFKTLRKKAAAVIDALQDEEMIEEE